MHDFELHEFFHSPKNVLLKALLYLPTSFGKGSLWTTPNQRLYKNTYLKEIQFTFQGATTVLD